MSLATRCTACGTIFRVVQDQLKVSEGWVRCGRCQQVFNALETLFDLDREAPPPWPTVDNPVWDATMALPPGAAPPRPAHAPAPATSPAPAPAPAPAATRTNVDIDTTVIAPTEAAPARSPASSPVPEPAPTPTQEAALTPRPASGLSRAAAAPMRPPMADWRPSAPAVSTPSFLRTLSREPAPPPPAAAYDDHDDEGESSGFAHARFNLDLIDDEHELQGPPDADEPVSTLAEGPATEAPPTQAPPFEPPTAEPLDAEGLEPDAPAQVAFDIAVPEAEVQPQFVQQAERAERWRHPAVRAVLVLLLLVSALGLAAQAAVQFRAPLVAQWPGARDGMEMLCAQVGCRLEPPRRLDSLTVDASGLTRTDTPGVYRLSLTLHNRAGLAVRMPAIELSLTDDEGKLVARKALMPEQLGAKQSSIAAHADAALQARLSTGSLRVVGYTVEIFYP